MSLRSIFRDQMRFQAMGWIFLFASIHFFLHFTLFAYSFSSIMNKFDSGEVATVVEEICWLSTKILQFPVVTTFHAIRLSGPLSSVLQYVPFILNSGLWGVVLWLFLRRFVLKRPKRF